MAENENPFKPKRNTLKKAKAKPARLATPRSYRLSSDEYYENGHVPAAPGRVRRSRWMQR